MGDICYEPEKDRSINSESKGVEGNVTHMQSYVSEDK